MLDKFLLIAGVTGICMAGAGIVNGYLTVTVTGSILACLAGIILLYRGIRGM